MNIANVYQKEDFWFVDFIDTERNESISAVGVFKNKKDAEDAAEVWKHEQETVENMGESFR